MKNTQKIVTMKKFFFGKNKPLIINKKIPPKFSRKKNYKNC